MTTLSAGTPKILRLTPQDDIPLTLPVGQRQG